ncbi:MAG: hypothetical protein D3923_02895 [Candidatus Electrothrix sp. AR3]|nr:hypothetical protein [Candidatus Electrothrix sp. AR3]
MKTMKLVALCIVVLSLFACTHSVPIPPTNPDQDNLSNNRALWESSHLSTYTYTYTYTNKRECLCTPVEDLLITVNNGQVTSNADTSPAPEISNQLMTVEELFQVIEQAISDQVDRLDVIYNPTLGYPERITIDVDERMVDEELIHIVKDLH